MRPSSANNNFVRCRPSAGLSACLCIQLMFLNTSRAIFPSHWLSFVQLS